MAPYVLLVESDPDLQQRIGAALREANYELSAETEAAWAKRSLLVRPPAAVILGTALSDGSGFTLAQTMRRDTDTRDVPIFFVAKRFRGASHRSEACRRFAPARYFEVPLDVESLLAAVMQTVPPGSDSSARPVPNYPAGGALADAAQRRERREVEAEARQLASGSAEFHGSLARQTFARLLQQLYAQRSTGALLLTREPAKKIMYFEDGYPTWIRSNVLGECLGQILVGEKLISKKALDRSLGLMKSEKRPQGELLVEMGALSPYNLARALLLQMEAKLYDVFSWQSGSFSFTEGEKPHGDPVRLEKTPAALIFEGVSRHYGETRLDATLAPLSGQYVVPTADPVRRMQDITHDPAELRFVSGLDGTSRLEALLSSAPVPLARARVLVAAMAEAGMVEPAQTATRRSIEKAATNDSDRPFETRTPEELAALLQTMRTQTYFELLGVSLDAGLAGIDRAYEQRARDFHPDRFHQRSEDIRATAQRIFDWLKQAHATLRSRPRRKKYIAALERARTDENTPVPVALEEATTTAADHIYQAGVENLRARRYSEAVEAFRQATLLVPDRADYHGALGWALYREAPADGVAAAAALHELEQAAKADVKNPWVRISLGRFFAETGRPDDAIPQFEAALALNSGLVEIAEEIDRLKGQT